MNKANECTCPSGDGSLVHPCPAHPAVEQAGGDERDFQAEGAQEVPSPVSQEYDRHLISLLRKGEALPGHQEEAADEIERLRDWNDHLNNTVLPNILNPNFLMLMKGGERLLDLCTKDGKFIGVSLNDMKDVFDWMVTHARIAPDQAALAQPSGEVVVTKNESGAIVSVTRQDKEGRVLSVIAESATLTAQAEKAEVERPEVVAWQYRVTAGPQTGWSLWHPGKGEEFERSYTVERRPLMTVAQHERIVGELRAVIAQLRQHKNDYMDAGQETYRALQNEIREREAEIARLDGLVSGHTAERDAALARVAELDQALAEKDPFGAKLNRISEKLERCDALLAARAAQAGQVPQAWLDVQAERRRQVEAEGWTPEHDDEHSHGQMARAAACYALAGSSAPNDGTAALLVSLAWPWDEQWWKPTSTRRDLVKACALALAEIERLDRAAAPGKEVGHE
ncbi:hypothetical protein ACOACP_31500 [Pseudomonas aeruginosa]|uniref:hypothetical protein n=1 Tax=Pseudomonas aeruginosa TaxID=287 RepID=UPI003BA161AE